MQAQLIALDWGTTSLRAYLLGPSGRVLSVRSLACGIMRLPSTPREIAGQVCADGFELAFDEACGDWLAAHPGIAVIACGMVGSAQGWREAPYRQTPASLDALSSALQTVRSIQGVDVHIVPGVIQHSTLPNVMRGEETQVLGVLHRHLDLNDCLIGLPGSHSKWVQVQDATLVHFDTFMTGEVYAAVSEHTILARTQQATAQFDAAAFEHGVGVALSPDGRAGLLSTLFSARTLSLTGQLNAVQQPDYVSGLLIGHELSALGALLRDRRGDQPLPTIILIGNAQLCDRYQRALTLCGFAHVRLAEQATEQGLWHLAHAAGLLQYTQRES
ncbi:2-dehydro-3-deoxygalactonokinase [Pseudomonas sp.]|uniref:2-dehydro-3-deoxygalactonokinase n=1 Tax=Pseudomonas sp. TaxID=306 RepID=UPI002616E826|nr:2-dehydro-3-deoxygalactonokinase [Pseudomonas sp.]